MKVPLKMGPEMVLEPSIIKKAEDILAFGIITKWMVMEHYIILMVESLTKVNGKTTHCMEKGFLITKNLIKFKDNTIIPLLISVKINNHGFYMMDGFKMMKNLDMDNYY